MIRNSCFNSSLSTKYQLDSMLRQCTLAKRQEIFNKITLRRNKQFQINIALQQNQEKLIEKQLSQFEQNIKLSKYASTSLDGIALMYFNKSLHFIFKKERQQGQQCSICAQTLKIDQLVSECFSCTHIFHSSCMEPWFKTKQKPQCPNCRSKLASKQAIIEPLKQLEDKLNQVRKNMNIIQEKEKLLLDKFKQVILKN